MNEVFGIEIPFATYCGVKAVAAEPGWCRLFLAMRDEHKNQLGIIHGGVMLTLLDVAMGTAARLSAGASVMTIDMQSSFLAPGRGDLSAEGRVLRPGRSLIFCDGEVRDAAGSLVAKASGLYKIAKATPAEKVG
ncbi:MAG: PaaI family thioesterase [Beijerinckiaceae bacterium]